MKKPTRCRAKDPFTCRNHGKYAQSDKLFNSLFANNFDRQLFEYQMKKYYTLKSEIEQYEAMGGPEFYENQKPFMKKQWSKLDKTLQQISNACEQSNLHEIIAISDLIHDKETLKGQVVERILSKALDKSGVNHTYVTGSHAPGADVFMPFVNNPNGPHDYGISVKSGVVTKKGLLKVTGSRTTNHKPLQDKLDHLHKTSPEAYFMLSNQWNSKRDYRMTLFPGQLLQYGDSSDWEEYEKSWRLIKPIGMLIKGYIGKNSSDQLSMLLDPSLSNFKGVTGDFKLV